MNRKTKYGFEISEVQRMLDSISPVIQIVQMSNAVAAAMPTSYINNQLIDATQPIREAAERWNQMYNSTGITRILESTTRISKMMRTSGIIEANGSIQSLLKIASLQKNIQKPFNGLNLGIDPAIFRTMQGLSVNISEIERAIQNNLNIFRGIDWSSIIEPQDLENFDIEKTLDGVTIDINDSISFQQQIAELVNRFKMKYPVVFYLIIWLVLSPIQSAITDEVLNLIKGTTVPIIQQVKTADYKYVEKNIKIDVNNILNVNIESNDVKDDLLKVFRYVSTDKLIMRQSNRVKSRVIYTLEFGQVVKVIHKDRNWSLVEYENDEDVIRGWVFTRYISKFKR